MVIFILLLWFITTSQLPRWRATYLSKRPSRKRLDTAEASKENTASTNATLNSDVNRSMSAVVLPPRTERPSADLSQTSPPAPYQQWFAPSTHLTFSEYGPKIPAPITPALLSVSALPSVLPDYPSAPDHPSMGIGSAWQARSQQLPEASSRGSSSSGGSS